MSELASVKREIRQLQRDFEVFQYKFRDTRTEFKQGIEEIRARHRETAQLMDEHERKMAEFRLLRERKVIRARDSSSS
jgi:methyl-accepting chemotaxis protein